MCKAWSSGRQQEWRRRLLWTSTSPCECIASATTHADGVAIAGLDVAGWRTLRGESTQDHPGTRLPARRGPRHQGPRAVGSFDAGLVNSILVPLERMRLASGWVESVVFTVQTKVGRSNAGVWPAYNNLTVECVASGTGSTSRCRRKALSFVTHWLLVRNDNHGPTARVGTAIRKTVPHHYPQRPYDYHVGQPCWTLSHKDGEIVTNERYRNFYLD